MLACKTLIRHPLLLAAFALLPAAVPAAPSFRGPPTLCHAVDIGSARSLPWGERAFDARADYDVGQLAADTYDILLRTDDVYVHMETLRRAAIYGTGAFGAKLQSSPEQRAAAVAALLEELQFDADVHAAAATEACSKATAKASSGKRFLVSPEPELLGGRTCQAQARNAALCWFDLGYLRTALYETDFVRTTDPLPALRNALALQPGDGRLELAMGLSLFAHQDESVRGERWQHLDAALRVAENADSADPSAVAAAAALRRNLLATVGPLVDAHDDEQVAAAIRQHLAGC